MDKNVNKYASALFERISEDKRQRILATAVREFAQNGFSNANVNRIAENAGISVGSLYKYFETKDDLFMYIVQEASFTIRKYTRDILDSDIDIFTKIEKLLRKAYEYSLEEPDLIKLYDVFTSDNDEKRAALIAERLEGVTSGAYRQLISSAQSRGDIRDDVAPGVLAFMIDNQLMVTQFSYANSYYKRRQALFLGTDGNMPDDKAPSDNTIDGNNDKEVDNMINNIMLALKGMLAPESK